MTNFTNEQLEAWASLGPWEWQKLAEFSSPKHSLGPGVLLTDERDGTPWGDAIDQTNAALIAAAPALAAALLAERKAREVEVEALKRTMFTVRVIAVDALFQPTFQRTALERISAELRAALEGPTP
jgi:hypothetical protein